MDARSDTFFRYPSVSAADQRWGLFGTTVGWSSASTNDPYPLVSHPPGYGPDKFWEHGRIFFARAIELVKLEPPGFQQTLAALVLEVLGCISSAHRMREFTEKRLHPIINEAKLLLAERLEEPLDLPGLASHLGVSYSSLRQAFKQHTGFALREYQLELRVREAKKLLAGTGLPVKTIADKLGFQSAYYFSRLFRTKTGFSPEAWRHQAHGGDHLQQVAMRAKQRSKPGSPNR